MAERTDVEPASGSPAELPSAHASREGGNLAALMELVRGGDPDAFAVLMSAHERQVRVYLAQLVGDDDQPCNLAQDVFLRVWDCIGDLRDPTSFRA